LASNLRVIQWRKAKGLTQGDLAEKCETTQQTIAKIEQGVVDPKVSTLEKIASALDCELVDLFYNKDSFAKDVNEVVERLKLNLAKINSLNLNQLCWKEAYVPPFHPLWSQYKIKENKIYFK
jgi:transcriptional regulator with XRE-family HTH domain